MSSDLFLRLAKMDDLSEKVDVLEKSGALQSSQRPKVSSRRFEQVQKDRL